MNELKGFFTYFYRNVNNIWIAIGIIVVTIIALLLIRKHRNNKEFYVAFEKYSEEKSRIHGKNKSGQKL